LLHDARLDPASSMTTTPTPAIVTQRAAQRLPRVPLFLLCAAYVLPGVFGRDPWKNADISAFGAMLDLAQGRASWLTPSIAGVPADAAPLPHWLGAAFISVLSPVADAAFAARVPFAMLLSLTLLLVWYTTFHLARTEAAQPVAFAFGGEADAIDYARAIADGALLALIASLGLLQLGHETTPELAQLAGVALLLWSLAAAPYRAWRSGLAALLALLVLAASGAPSMALAMGALGVLTCVRSGYGAARLLAIWVAVGTVAAAALATLGHLWAWRLVPEYTALQVVQIGRLVLWFAWPAWPLALWTLWRWRRQLFNRHIAVPLGTALVSLVTCIAMGGSDRALMLALPGLAVLAAFALPTMKRSVTAAIDWFSVFFFTICAIAIWVVYMALQTGVPASTAANVARLAPLFKASFSGIELVIALLATVAWAALVRWRTGRHRQALWKSLVLPASGVALSWLLLMTLLLPVLDYARSYRPLVERIARHVPANACVAAPGMTRSALAALEYFGRWQVDGRAQAAERTGCQYLMLQGSQSAPPAPPPGWTLVARELRPTDRDETMSVYRR
jgi:4-amino-4-deoxy-L-arabinose transferase-like glycosyltransferase